MVTEYTHAPEALVIVLARWQPGLKNGQSVKNLREPMEALFIFLWLFLSPSVYQRPAGHTCINKTEQVELSKAIPDGEKTEQCKQHDGSWTKGNNYMKRNPAFEVHDVN